MNFIKSNAGHLLGLALAVAGFIGVHSYIGEHDARIIAEAKVQAAETTVKASQAQEAAVASTAGKAVTTLRKQARSVKTAPEAIKALPSVSEGLHEAAVPDAPERVAVDALPLYVDLNTCKQCSVNLAASTEELALERDASKAKDLEITALKKKPGFWHRVKETAITVGIGAAVGYALHR